MLSIKVSKNDFVGSQSHSMISMINKAESAMWRTLGLSKAFGGPNDYCYFVGVATKSNTLRRKVGRQNRVGNPRTRRSVCFCLC